jgi:hypothetical protein
VECNRAAVVDGQWTRKNSLTNAFCEQPYIVCVSAVHQYDKFVISLTKDQIIPVKRLLNPLGDVHYRPVRD